MVCILLLLLPSFYVLSPFDSVLLPWLAKLSSLFHSYSPKKGDKRGGGSLAKKCQWKKKKGKKEEIRRADLPSPPIYSSPLPLVSSWKKETFSSSSSSLFRQKFCLPPYNPPTVRKKCPLMDGWARPKREREIHGSNCCRVMARIIMKEATLSSLLVLVHNNKTK